MDWIDDYGEQLAEFIACGIIWLDTIFPGAISVIGSGFEAFLRGLAAVKG